MKKLEWILDLVFLKSKYNTVESRYATDGESGTRGVEIKEYVEKTGNDVNSF